MYTRKKSDFVKSLPYFSRWSASKCLRFSRYLNEKTLPPRSVLYRAWDTSNWFVALVFTFPSPFLFYSTRCLVFLFCSTL